MISIRLTPALGALSVLVLGATEIGAAPGDAADRVGVMTHFAQNWSPDLLSRLDEAGVRHVRDELYWNVLERRRGEFVFPPRYENYMGELGRREIRPLIALTFENRHYDGGLTPHTDDGFAAYARYAVEVLRHYGAQIEAVEVWNEYNGSFAKGPATEDRAGTYVRMLRVAHAAIKRERPDVLVIGGATSGLPLPYLEKLFAAGALEHMDAVSVHPYQTRETPEGLDQRIDALHALIARYNQGRPKPVWVTEIGWPLHKAEAPGDLAVGEREQAAFLVRAYALLLSSDVVRVYWYLLKDHHQFANMGLVRDTPDAAPRPAFTAMATLVDQLRGVRALVREPAPEGVYCVRLERDAGQSARLLWSVRPFPLAVAPFARVVDLHGTESAAPGHLLLGGDPVYLKGDFHMPSARADEAADLLLAESEAGFSLRQGEQGWSYGVFMDEATEFVPLARSRTTDWKQEWIGAQRNLSISAVHQHPAAQRDMGVAAVRRWTSERGGALRVSGRFKASARGDGVRVRVFADGAPRFSALIGGGDGRGLLADFDFLCAVGPGGHLDFAVDPGPERDPDYDVTQVSISIHSL